jgi:phosphohistidine swiveling domain-containing protein
MVTSYNDNFEVVWADPANAARNWGFDRLHYPRPQPPLTQAFFERMMSLAFDVPTVFVNNYAFMREYGPPPPTPEVEEHGPAYVWEHDNLPRVQAHCRAMRHADYDSMSTSDLANAIEDYFLITADVFRLTTVLIRAYLRPMAGLIAFCETELGEDGALLAARLLQNSDNATSAAGFGLSELTQLAVTLPEVAEALKAGRFGELASLSGGPRFLERLQAYLDEYGWRVESWALPHIPTWAEENFVPLSLISRYLQNPGLSPERALKRSVEQRGEARRELEGRLDSEKLAEFRELMESAANQVAISEARALWQLVIIGSVRVPVMALGRKFAAGGVISKANDIFFLRLEELPVLALKPRPMQREIESRKAELLRCENLRPPGYLGMPPAMDSAPSDMQTVMRHLRGYGVAMSEDERVINGLGASKGIVRGRARVLRGMDEANRLQEGDVLVCRTTAPPWTPLFSIAAAVVTDAGGILSHSAICAREYGIAAVVGTQVATSRIPDGAMVIVDGDKGTVTIEA